MNDPIRFALAIGLQALAAGCARADGPDAGDEAASATATPAAPAPRDGEPGRTGKGRYAPRDECGRLPGASAFRAALVAATKARDADALIALASPKIELDFGGGSGTGLLRERLADPQYDLWAELDEIVTLGCAAGDNGEITLPWLFAQDFGDFDVLNSLIVTGEDVPLRASADTRSAEIARISWDTVKLAERWSPDAPFFKVTTADGKTGHIPRGMTRPIAGYRVIAARDGDSWRMVAFIAGD